MKFKDFKWVLPDKAEATTKTNGIISTMFSDCVWWNITYRSLIISVYYDPNNNLGYMTTPYFEVMSNSPDEDDPSRYLLATDTEEMFEDIAKLCAQHDIDIIERPEFYL